MGTYKISSTGAVVNAVSQSSQLALLWSSMKLNPPRSGYLDTEGRKGWKVTYIFPSWVCLGKPLS